MTNEIIYNTSEFLIPSITPHQLTYNEIIQGMQGQLSDKFYYISIIILSYILLNMFVFKENARFRKWFDQFDDEKYKIAGVGSLRDLIIEIWETSAFMGAIMLVFLNIVFRTGLNI